MTERDVRAMLAEMLRNHAREQDKINRDYARELRARSAGHARRALGTGK